MGKKKRREYQLPKASRKVGLPVDRTGRPIHVGDVVSFMDGTVLAVSAMTWCGDGDWLLVDETGECFSDNPAAALVIWSRGGKA